MLVIKILYTGSYGKISGQLLSGYLMAWQFRHSNARNNAANLTPIYPLYICIAIQEGH